jgi:hypothetical protein
MLPDDPAQRQWELSDWLVDLLGDAAAGAPADLAERFAMAAARIPGLHVDRLETIVSEARNGQRVGLSATEVARVVAQRVGV